MEAIAYVAISVLALFLLADYLQIRGVERRIGRQNALEELREPEEVKFLQKLGVASQRYFQLLQNNGWKEGDFKFNKELAEEAAKEVGLPENGSVLLAISAIASETCVETMNAIASSKFAWIGSRGKMNIE